MREENSGQGHSVADETACEAWSGGRRLHGISHLGLVDPRAQGRTRMGNKGGGTEEPVIRAQMQSWKRWGFAGSEQVSVGGQANHLTALWELSIITI